MDGATGLDDPLSVLRVERASAYRSLVRARALALSRLGRHAEAVEALTSWCREHPRDEEVRCCAARRRRWVHQPHWPGTLTGSY